MKVLQLAAPSIQASGAISGDRPGRDNVPELGKFGRNDLLAPRWVLKPHPADQGPQIHVYRGPASRMG